MPFDAKRVQAIFAAALELSDVSERAALLDHECGGDAELRQRVEILLAAHDDSAGLPAADPHGTGAFVPGGKSIELSPGTLFAGRYKIREKLGEGGMGTVYVADQTEPVQRRIALKIIKTDIASDRLLARFEQERQALALMDHPNIAKVLDAGIALDSPGAHATGLAVPYFVMELIKGVPITKYCDEAKLTPKQRLELFIPVCQAVQHAHQKGIIHRDLKPSNILIGLYDGRPVPKVIDFGVAKATGAKLTDQSVYTEVGSLIGTLEYMSPEQAELNNLDIDTRSDIYALGVVLYELLTGTVPHSRKELKSAGFAEMLRVIKEVEPPKPSTRLSGSGSLPSIAASRHTEPKRLTALLRNDLDWIVMKALEKDRSRRYETANGFAMDIQRYLADEPVLAGPPSAGYRLRKFVKRNKVQVVAGLLVLLALVSGIAGTTFGFFRAEHRRQDAEQAKAKEAEQRSKAEKARDRTRQALDAMTSSITGDSLTTQKTISKQQKQFLTEVLTHYKEFAGENADDEQSRLRTAWAAYRVGLIEAHLGRTVESESALRYAYDAFDKLTAEFPDKPEYRQDLAQSQNRLGNRLTELGQSSEAENLYRKALTIQEKLTADFPAEPAYRDDLVITHNHVGNRLKSSGKLSEAEKQYRQAVAIGEKLVAEFLAEPQYRLHLAFSHSNLGAALGKIGRAEADRHYREAISILAKLVADFPDDLKCRELLSLSHHNLGALLVGRSERAEGEQHYRKALAIHTKLADEFPSVPEYRQFVAEFAYALGELFHELGKRGEAKEQYQKMLAIREKLASDYPAITEYRQLLVVSHNSLGIILASLGERRDAEEQYRKALAIHENLPPEFRVVPNQRHILAMCHNNLGALLADLGRPMEAEQQYRESLVALKKLVAEVSSIPDYRQLLGMTHNNLGNILKAPTGRAEAEEQYRAALEIRKKLVADFPNVLKYYVDLAGSYCSIGVLIAQGGKPSESLEWFDNAIQTMAIVYERDRQLDREKQLLLKCHANRATAYNQLRKYAESAKDWDKVIELSPVRLQPGFRIKRFNARVQAGQFAEAVVDVAELTKSSNWNVGQWYDFACVYAIASGKIADKKQEYADRAMELLQKAVKAGYKDAAHMAKDTDLDSLRGRADFKKLMAELQIGTTKQP